MTGVGEYGEIIMDTSNYDQIRELYPNYFKEYAAEDANQVKVNHEAEVDWPALVK